MQSRTLFVGTEPTINNNHKFAIAPPQSTIICNLSSCSPCSPSQLTTDAGRRYLNHLVDIQPKTLMEPSNRVAEMKARKHQLLRQLSFTSCASNLFASRFTGPCEILSLAKPSVSSLSTYTIVTSLKLVEPHPPKKPLPSSQVKREGRAPIFRLARKPEANQVGPNNFTPINAVELSYMAEAHHEH